MLIPSAEPWSPRTRRCPGGTLGRTRNAVRGRRRGIITVGPVQHGTGRPVGPLPARGRGHRAEEIIVHPRTVRLERLGAGLLRDLEGQSTKDLASHDLAFHALRPYVPGDERRHIHWRSSARVGA